MLPLIAILPLLYCCQRAKPSPTWIRPLLPLSLYLPFVQFFLPLLLFPFCLWHVIVWGIVTISRVPLKNRPPKSRKTITGAAGTHQPCAFWHILPQRYDNPLAHCLGYSKLGKKDVCQGWNVQSGAWILSSFHQAQLLTNLPKHGSAMGINGASPVLCQWKLWRDSTQHPVYLNVPRYYSHISLASFFSP